MLVKFNQPPILENSYGKSSQLRNFILDSFRSATNGSRVWGSMYIWTSVGFTNQLDEIRLSKKLEFHFYAGNSEFAMEDKVEKFFNKPGVYGKIYDEDPDNLRNHTKMFVFESINWNVLFEKYPESTAGKPIREDGPAILLFSANLTSKANTKSNNGIIIPINRETLIELRGYYQHIKKGYVSVSGEGTNVHIHAMKSNGKVGTNFSTLKWTSGWTKAKPFTVGTRQFLLIYKKNTGKSHIINIRPDGSLTKALKKYNWTEGWTTMEFYSIANKTYLLRLKKSTGILRVHEMNEDGTRGRKVDARNWSSGWTQAKPYKVGSKHYLFLLKEGNGRVHIHEINQNGTIGERKKRYNWSSGWSSVEFYTVNRVTYLFLLKKGPYEGGRMQINKLYDHTKGKRIYRDTWTHGWTSVRPFTIGSQQYIFLLKEGNGIVRIRRIKANGTIGNLVKEYNWTDGWTTAEIFKTRNYNCLFLLKEKKLADTKPQKKNRYKILPCGNETFYLFPQRPFKIDTLAEILKRIQHFDHAVNSECTVRLVTPRWRGRVEVLNCLERLRKNGANIEIVTRNKKRRGEPEVPKTIMKRLKKCATLYFQKPYARIHSKYVIIDAPYKQSDNTYKRVKMVWASTQNITESAMKNNWEISVLLHDNFDAYRLHLIDFKHLCKEPTAAPIYPNPN